LSASDLKVGTSVTTVDLKRRVSGYGGGGVYKNAMITKLWKRSLRLGEDVVTVKHDAFYSQTSLTTEARILSWGEKVSWMSCQELGSLAPATECVGFVLPPDHLPLEGTDRRLTFELGYVIGVYLRIGSLHAFPETRFVLDVQNAKCLKELQRCAIEYFKTAPLVSKHGHLVQVTFLSKYMYNALMACGVAARRQLPTNIRYETASSDFHRGLSHGIVMSGRAGMPRVTPSILETLYTASMMCGIPLCNGLQSRTTEEGVRIKTCIGRVSTFEKVAAVTHANSSPSMEASDLMVVHPMLEDDEGGMPALVVNNLLVHFDAVADPSSTDL
jgi:hypothetical protein